MSFLGRKLGRVFSSLGSKVTRTVNRLGEKGMSLVNQVKRGVADIPGQANQFAKNIVLQSGAVTDGLRIGTNIADKIMSGAVGLGAGNIPIAGKYIEGGAKVMSGLKQGAEFLDQKRDQEEARLRRNAEGDRMRNTVLEKMNGRKQAAIVAADDISSPFA